MADGDTYINIGTTLAVAAAAPATYDAAGFGAIAGFEPIGGVISIPEAGDTAADVSEPTLADGRVEHFNGQVDGGELSVPIKYIEGDAGQEILEAGAGTNTVHSFRETDADGQVFYYAGRIASYRSREKTASSFKGYIAVIRVNTARFRGDAGGGA